MKSWTIGNKVQATCVILSALVLLASVVGLVAIARNTASLKAISTESIPSLDKVLELRAAALEIRGSTYLMALPELADYKAKQLVRVAELEQKIPELLRTYESSGRMSGAERPLFDSVKEKATPFLEVSAHYREMANAGKLKEASDFWKENGTTKWPPLRKALQNEYDFQMKAIAANATGGLAASSSAGTLTWGLLILTLIVSLALCIFVVRSINTSLEASTRAIRSSATQVTSASAQVASAGELLSKGASMQAATLQETSASGQEVSAMTSRNSENSRTAASLMTEVGDKVTLANEKLEQMIISMGQITNSSERIAKIIKVIDEIAFQTNILALNAAVEAARAGEAGLGFAVVAEEVRNLAQRCAQAAKDTTNLIEESVTSARTGGTRLDEVADVIRGITESAVKVKTLIDEVSQSGIEQARGIDQISRALVQMERTTQESAASAEESASASQHLKAQAESIEQTVHSLEALISRSSAGTRASSSMRTVPLHDELDPLESSLPM